MAEREGGGPLQPWRDAPPLELAEDVGDGARRPPEVFSAGDASAEDLKRLDRKLRRWRGRKAVRVHLILPFFVLPFVLAIGLSAWAHQSALVQMPEAMNTLLGHPFAFDRERITAGMGWHPRVLFFWLMMVGGAVLAGATPDRITGWRWPGALLLGGLAAGAWFLPADWTRLVLANAPAAPMRHVEVAAQALPSELLLVGTLATFCVGWYAGRSRQWPWTLVAIAMAAGMAWLLAQARIEALEETLRDLIVLLNRGGAPRSHQLVQLSNAFEQAAIPLHARALADALLLLTPWWVAARITDDRLPIPDPDDPELT